MLGVINIPAVALGMFSGGLLMKRLKLNLMGAAKFAFGTSLIGYILSLFFFAMSCENAKVAGVTVAYNRSVTDYHMPCWCNCCHIIYSKFATTQYNCGSNRHKLNSPREF